MPVSLADRSSAGPSVLSDPDWKCPWPLSWQRHFRVLADLVDAAGVLPYIAPGVTFEGDDIWTWRWRQQEPGTWAQLMPEQRERLEALGVRGAALPGAAAAPAELRPALAAALKGPKKPGSKAEAAFQRGLTALEQWVEEGQRPAPRGAVVDVVIDGETVPVKLGVWLSNTKSRRDKLTPEQGAALAALGMEWAGPGPGARGRLGAARRTARAVGGPGEAAGAEAPRGVRRRAVQERELHLLVHQAVRAALRAGELLGQPLTAPPPRETPGRL
ncbi:helicase associated domain-containing protein [Streptomyces bacillaris]|uniref:helicase associated domain-containing protein n=1 Tax=Streptomyces bacillaris TaxID=68179 RepID=UPI0035E364B0